MKKRMRWLILLILLLNVASGLYVVHKLWLSDAAKQASLDAPETTVAQEAAPEAATGDSEAAPPSDAPTAGPEPIARLVQMRESVKSRSAGSEEWIDARSAMPLHQNDALRTYESSSASLEFGSGDSLEIEENTLFVIRPPRREAGIEEIALSVVPGDLFDGLGSKPAAERARTLAAETEKRQITLKPVRGSDPGKKTRVIVKALPDSSTGVEVQGGAVEVTGTQGPKVTVQEKMVTRVSDKGAVAEPRAPLAAPELVSPKDRANFTFQSRVPRVDLLWKEVERASEYRIVVARDTGFKKIFADEKVKGTSLAVSNLPSGTYYWRVCAREADGFVGPYSAARAVVAVYDDAPPTLSILSPPEMYVSPTPSVELKVKTESGARAKVNGQKVNVSTDGSFVHPVALKEGVNLVTVEVVDAAGNLAYGKRLLTYKGSKRSPSVSTASKP
jgi:hypothetical protein